jgi:hypothetical protein
VRAGAACAAIGAATSPRAAAEANKVLAILIGYLLTAVVVVARLRTRETSPERKVPQYRGAILLPFQRFH